ncbi:hypothetical protein BDV96DRAFT_647905 [Lophiotrema nucula]|uniref:Actin-like ATPase domain-containing protein n=1 Tax=Lophiotrema nucula TaxID=690887 RepID=A0A6A5Z5Q4_9PLEO|nr:hypothetical protein BDV96DRAFT_647905 [Lophiotrema nucula]
MAEDIQDQPMYRVTTPSSPSRAPPPVPPPIPSSQSEITLRRPSPYALGPSAQSSHSRYSSLASPRSQASSRTSYSTGGQERDQVLNIGIDFGTTYSGVAWTISGSNPKVEVVTSWPNAPGEDVKVPSAISYKDGSVTHWGYSIPPEAEPVRWFKLLLLSDLDLPPKVRNHSYLKAARKLLQKLNKDVVDVIADYLQKLWECAMNDIRRALSSSMEGMPFRIIMTVPANWPRDALNSMKKAAQKAGLLDHRGVGLETRLEFVKEPEAAALASFLDGEIRRGRAMGDIVTICDAGGGTVDIATYDLQQVGPPVHLGEYISGDADMCGAIFLDEEFQKYIEAMIGKDKIAKLPRRVQEELMNRWEYNIKRQYQKDTTELVPTMPHEITKAIKSPKNLFRKAKGSKQLSGDAMRFSAEDIRKMFDPVMTSILTLLHEQRVATLKERQRKPDAILLVGGLGSNIFLHQRLEAEFAAKDIELLQPRGPQAWSAVCRGAAIKGATFDDHDDQDLPVVTSYISKAHYGIAYKVPFEASKHSEEDKKFDAATSQELAYNQMRWYVAKGDNVMKGDPVTLSWERYIPESRPCTSFTVKVYESESDTAPSRLNRDVHECEPIVVPIIWKNLIPRDGADGQKFRRIQFNLKLSMLGLGKLDFAAYVEGSLVGRRQVSAKLGDSGLVPQ